VTGATVIELVAAFVLPVVVIAAGHSDWVLPPGHWRYRGRAGRRAVVLIGAQPFTGWLPEAVGRDQWGYILTGPDLAERWTLQREPYLLETSTPGVFAVGDVRHGSVKRVASAVGDGSIAIRLAHDYLA
jgi:hypothetical protein